MTDDEIPSPSSNSSFKIEEPHTLSERINISTRSTHTQLNRLIIARLPLALPPYASNPSTYTTGLFHIAPIYITFESLWERILEISDTFSIPVNSFTEFHSGTFQAKICSQTYTILSHLWLPGLARSGRLRADIQTLSRTSEEDIEEKLCKIPQNGKVSDFITHITTSVTTNPHVLLAYAWVLYMALFSGGRYIRAFLQDAGEDFWTRSPSSIDEQEVSTAASHPERLISPSESHPPRVTRGLQFFHFPGEEDGEDIKKEFKKRFAEAEIKLSREQKNDIIQEAQHVFDFMLEIVGELDRVCGPLDLKINQNEKKNMGMAIQGPNSVFVAKEGLSRIYCSRAENRNASIPSFIRALGHDFSGTGPLIAKKDDLVISGISKFRIGVLDTNFLVSVFVLVLALGISCFVLHWTEGIYVWSSIGRLRFL